MKLIKIAGLGLVGLVVLAVLVLLFGVPAQPLIGFLSDRAATAGYQLRVDGSSRLSLWSSLNLSANDIRLKEAKDARDDILAAKQVRVGISLLGLLTGNIHVSEVVLTQPVIRLISGRPGASSRASTASADESAERSVGVDRFTIEDGTLIMHDVRESFEDRIDSLQLTASIPPQGPLDVKAEGNAGGQILRFAITANSASQIMAGRSAPVEVTLELPGILKQPMSFTATLKTTNQVVSMDGVRGTLGSGRMTGSMSVDTAGLNPSVRVNLVFDRLELGTAESRAASGNEPWSDRPIEFGELRIIDASVKVSARELVVGKIKVAPAEIEANLAGGLMSVLLSRSELYGGPIQGRLVIDAGARTPRLGASFEFARVSALPFLTDAVGFDHLEGRLQAKFDVTATGVSPYAIVSSLGGTAELNFEDGAIRDVNVPGMIRALSMQTLQGWQEKGQEKTDFASLNAPFRVANGQATADDLRLAGPLVRMTGKGTANLVARTLDFRVDPKLVLTLQGQGGPSDPAGLGVPVVIRGPWDEPQIYPEVAGILDNPEGAFAKLKSMGGSLFGLLDPTGSGAKKLPKPEDVIKSLDQMIRGDGRGRQSPSDTKNQVRDVIRDLLGR